MDHEDHDETAHLVASKKIMTTENQKSIGLSREQNAPSKTTRQQPKAWPECRQRCPPTPTRQRKTRSSSAISASSPSAASRNGHAQWAQRPGWKTPRHWQWQGSSPPLFVFPAWVPDMCIYQQHRLVTLIISIPQSSSDRGRRLTVQSAEKLRGKNAVGLLHSACF